MSNLKRKALLFLALALSRGLEIGKHDFILWDELKRWIAEERRKSHRRVVIDGTAVELPYCQDCGMEIPHA